MAVNPVIDFRKPKKPYSDPEADYSALPKDYAQGAPNAPPVEFDQGGVDKLAALSLPEITEPGDVYEPTRLKGIAEKAYYDAKQKRFDEVQAKYPQAVQTGPGSYHIPAPGGWRDSLSADEAWIIERESGFNPAARNPSSGAFGLWQGLGSTLTGQASKHGFDPYTTDPNQQLVMFRDYVQGRYGSAAAAVEFWKKNGWY